MLRDKDFYHLLENIKKKIVGYRIRFFKTCSQKRCQETEGLLGNKIADAVTNSYDDKIVKTKHVEEIIIPPEKKRWNSSWIKIIIIKMEHYKISKILNNSTVKKFVFKFITKK